MLKKSLENPNRRSAHYQKQSPFEGSNRQIRGMILKALTCQPHVTGREIARQLQVDTAILKKTCYNFKKRVLLRRFGEKLPLHKVDERNIIAEGWPCYDESCIAPN